ncbi:uncharacterized protein LOC6524853 [Drosophila yakuba]|uniref:Uncharacterized protein, isoform B n=1 Tax=Drosophila yakuba TaxID=7245 RepID=B4PWQ5_DROYA|nr:uncharacterized protein LOC6524853 [Drosophila yakuba]EDX01801.2 uncharacterized protein Dyak_GE16033, isoform B [Drosophila yakuba]KRK06345.1 uncharacterized protein Dyak_GE16033, isoform C [Drosophila yakuba]
MLKWAVNQPRNSYLANELAMGSQTGSGSGSATGSGSGSGSLEPKTEVAGASYSEFHALRGKLKRKSIGVAAGKENQLTSTPLPASSLSLHTRTPLLKDVSNILATPPSGGVSGATGGAAAAPLKFACTLPTFEAEYSPNAAVIPGSLIALRGVGIPDSYFEKPRYLEQKPLPHPHPHPVPLASEQNTLSSSQMGDVTLERMIDAILESNRKVLPNSRQQQHQHQHRQPRQHLRQRHRLRQQVLRSSHAHTQTPSPTYRPAFDPASDLCEYWKSPSRRDSLPANGFEEREVRSPTVATESQDPKRHSLQLRRQRVVRRKRKIATKISSSVRQSAQKLLAAARSGSAVPSQRCVQKRRHISPDSGHNSTSDFEEELVAMGSCGGRVEAVTKRRLSFSYAEDLFVEK